MAVDVKQYYLGLLKDAGVADDKLQAFTAVLDDEKVAKKLIDDSIAPRMRHDEFSREMDKITKERKDTADWYAKELKLYNDTNALKAQYEAKLASGEIREGDRTVVTNPTDGFTKKQFEEEMAKREQQTLGLLKVGLNLVGKHMSEFKEPLDTEGLSKVAIEKGLSLQQAYDEMVAPRRAEAQKTQREAELKAAEEKGARDFASKHHIPSDVGPKEPHMIFDKSKVADDISKLPQPQRERALRESFVQQWQEAGTSGG